MNPRAYNNGLLYDGLRAADSLIAKALGVGYAAQIRLIEKRLYLYINREWNDLAEEAAKKASDSIRKGAGRVVTANDIEAATKIIDYTMSGWAPRVTSRFTTDMKEVYGLGRFSGSKKVSVAKAEKPRVTTWVKPSFDLVDSEVVEAYANHQTFWIGRFYNEDVQAAVAAMSMNQVLTGTGRIVAGKQMHSVAMRALKEVRVPDGYTGSTSQYFEGLVANATTVERTTGHLRSFAEAGYTTYMITNPWDHRTCDTCHLMHGKQFRVTDGMTQVGKVITAPTPNDVRKVHPWLTPNRAKELTGGKVGAATPAQTEALRKAGHSMPTFHYFCRCDLDIVERSLSPVRGVDSDVPPLKPSTPSAPKPSAPKMPVKPAEPPPQITPPTPAIVPENRFVRPGLPSQTELRKKTNINLYNWQRDHDSGWNKYEVFRETIHDNMPLWGVDVLDERYMGMLPAPKHLMPNAAGAHWPTGHIAIREDYMNAVGRSFRTLIARDTADKSLASVNTIYHEVMHGANRIQKTASGSASRFMSEVLNETASRRIVLDFMGAVDTGASSARVWGAYQLEIDEFVDIIAKHTTWSYKEIDGVIEHAALAMQSKAANVVTEENAIFDEVIRHMRHKKEITDEVADKIKKDLSRCTVREFEYGKK